MSRTRALSSEALISGAFGALILFGCGLRFWRLAELGFWYDELWAVVGASGRPLREVYREWMLGDSHPPGFFLANFLWFKIAPATEFWARIPHAAASAATVLYLLAGTARVLTRDERRMAAAFLALSYLPIHFALEVKQYSWMLLLATVATVAYLEIVTTRAIRRRTGLALGASLVALAWLDYFATVYAALILVSLGLVFRADGAARRRLATLDAVFAVCYLPIVPFLHYQLTYTPGGWQRPDVQRFVPDYLGSLLFNDQAWVWSALGVLAASVVVAAIARRDVRAALRAPRTVHLLALFGTMTTALLAIGLWQPVFFPRYFLMTFPAALVLIGIATAAAFPSRVPWLAAVPVLFLVKAAVVQVDAVESLRRQEWDRSVDIVLRQLRPGDHVFVLGAGRDKTSFEYLQEGNVDGVFYVKNVEFYEYYFRRRGAAAVASQLEVVEPTPGAVERLARRFRGSGKTVYVLAGHHIAFGAAASAVLADAARKVETTELASTLVYALRF